MVLTEPMQVTYTIGAWAAGGTDEVSCRWSVPTTTLFNGPPRKTHVSERPYGLGAYRSRSYLAGRSFTLQGWCMPMVEPSWPLLVAARSRLMSVLADGRQGLLVVDDGVAARQITVELDEAAPRWEWWDANGGADWGLDFYAADPRFLSTEVLTAAALPPSASTDGLDWTTGSPGGLDWTGGGTGGLDWGTSGTGVNILTLNNPGTAPTWPVLTFTTSSTLTNPALQDPVSGAVLSYLGSIVAGQTLVIDTSPFTRSVTLDGVDRLGAMGLVGWPEIKPGTTLNLQFTGSGTGTVVAEWQAAYL